MRGHIRKRHTWEFIVEMRTWLEGLSREVSAGHLLSRHEQVLVSGLVSELEANLGSGFAGPSEDGLSTGPGAPSFLDR
jgi:hypothetical protein